MRVSLLALALVACSGSAQTYTTNVEVVGVEAFKDETGTPRMYALELKYADCPADARRFIRADASFAKCADTLKPGTRAPADLVSTYSSERGTYRSDITRLGDCPLKQDPKDEANYETLQTCSDVKASGFTIGVRCDRTRSKELLAKCPWLRR
jgi:hypothetical protein